MGGGFRGGEVNALATISPPTFRPIARESYMSSNTGKARASIANASELADKVKSALDDLATAITVGNGTKIARDRLGDAVLDLRLVCADADAFVRLMEAES